MTVTNFPEGATNTCPQEENINRPLLNDETSTKPGTVNHENSDVKDGAEETALLNRDDTTPDILRGQGKNSERNEKDEDGASATMVVPPDGGWGWVVVAASFFCNFVVDGIIFCFGNFKSSIAREFEASDASVSLVGSLLTGFYLIIGPFVSALANRYGFRLVTIAGAVLASAGFALSSLAESIEFLYFSYGILGGIGFGMIYAPSIITVGFYFERWRALATGIAVCGSGIGTFVLAPISDALIKHLEWKNALLVQAFIILVICTISGTLFRPLKPVRVTLDKDEEEELPRSENNLLHRIKLARDEDLRKSESMNSLKNTKYPTAAEILNVAERPDSAATVTTKLSKSTQSLNFKNMIIGHNVDLGNEQKRLSAPNMNQIHIPLLDEREEKRKNFSSHEDVGTPKSIHKRRNRTASEASSTGTGNRSRRGTVTECTIRSRRGTITQLDGNVNRPLYRDDIFFSASLHRLPQYKSERDFMGYTLSVTRLPTKKDLEEEEEFHCCPEAVKRAVGTMLDVSLLKSISFILLCISGFLTLMGFFTPFIYLRERAMEGKALNSTEEWDNWLVPSVGITNTVGRILCGILSSFPGANALLINNVALTVGGIATIFSGISPSAPYQFTYSVLFGFSTACFASLRSILIVDLLGLEKLTNAFGILLLFQGVAAALGNPIAGLVKEMTGNYDGPFYLAGSLILLSGILCYPLNCLNRWEKKKRKNFIDGKSNVI